MSFLRHFYFHEIFTTSPVASTLPRIDRDRHAALFRFCFKLPNGGKRRSVLIKTSDFTSAVLEAQPMESRPDRVPISDEMESAVGDDSIVIEDDECAEDMVAEDE